MQLSIALLNARLQVIAEAINGRPITLYSGVMPTELGELSEDNQALLSIVLPTPCYSNISNGVMLMQPLDATMVQTTGSLSWARIYDNEGVAAIDLSISGVDGHGDLKLPVADTTVYQGAYLRLSDWAIR